MVSSLDKPASDLFDASGAPCDKCKDDIELDSISSKFIVLLKFERCILKENY